MFNKIVSAFVLFVMIATSQGLTHVKAAIIESQDFSCSEQWVDGVMVSTTCQAPDLSYWSYCQAGGGWMGEPENSEYRWMVTCVVVDDETPPTVPETPEEPGTIIVKGSHPFPVSSAQKAENAISNISLVHESETMWVETWPGGNSLENGTKVLVVVVTGGDYWYLPAYESGEIVHEHRFYKLPGETELHTR